MHTPVVNKDKWGAGKEVTEKERERTKERTNLFLNLFLLDASPRGVSLL